MDKNTLKDLLASHCLQGLKDEIMLIEQYVDENEGNGEISALNYRDHYERWFNSYSGKLTLVGLFNKTSKAEVFARLQRGLTSIERDTFIVLENTHSLGTYVVLDRESHLFGLITENKEEILPCIFSNVYVAFDWFVEVAFVGHKYSFSFNSKDNFSNQNSQKGCFQYMDGEAKTYEITNEFDYRGSDNPLEQKLFELLNEKHKLVSTDKQ